MFFLLYRIYHILNNFNVFGSKLIWYELLLRWGTGTRYIVDRKVRLQDILGSLGFSRRSHNLHKGDSRSQSFCIRKIRQEDIHIRIHIHSQDIQIRTHQWMNWQFGGHLPSFQLFPLLVRRRWGRRGRKEQIRPEISKKLNRI